MIEVVGVKLYDVNDIAEMMGVGKYSVYSYINKKGLKSRKINGKRYITEENLKEFLMTDENSK